MKAILDLIWGLFTSGDSLRTMLRVVITVTVTAAIFAAVNIVLNQARPRWTAFNAVVGAVVGLIIYGVADGNRLLADVAGRPFVWPILGAAVTGTAAGALSVVSDPRQRVMTAAASGAVVGGLLGALMRSSVHPSLSIGPLVIWLAVGAAALAGFAAALGRRGRSLVRPALGGGAVGAVFGGWGGADLGDGNAALSIVFLAVVGAALGVASCRPVPRTDMERGETADQSRVWVFVGPALLFTAFGLVVPLFRTTVLSLRNARSTDWAGLGNYKRIFTDSDSVDLSGWPDIFSARVFWIGLALVAAGAYAGLRSGRETGRRFEFNGGSMSPVVFGWFLVACGVLANIRGTVFNNLWWVITVTFLTTSIGMAVAVLSDKARFERVAKSLIFMPMAISFIGAGIIWRFMFQAKNVSKPQNGVMNYVWVGMGEVTTDSAGKWICAVVLVAILSVLGYIAYVGHRGRAGGMLWGSVALAVPITYVLVRVLGGGFGGLPGETAQDKAIDFINTPPYNNMWLMVILIWIQTGFAMVIFSAAIRSVPQELIEAARMDGASESQTFWRVIIPQIMPTVGVVVTTLILLVMKVFDIVSVTTNGNFDTQVLANDMWQSSFRDRNLGLGSALAVVLFISVVPVMVMNVRRMQRERGEEY